MARKHCMDFKMHYIDFIDIHGTKLLSFLKSDSVIMRASLLFQVTNLQPGAKVRVMEDGTKMRRLQSGHGGWLDSYISVRICPIQLNLIDPNTVDSNTVDSNTVDPNYSIFRMDFSRPVFSFLFQLKNSFTCNRF